MKHWLWSLPRLRRRALLSRGRWRSAEPRSALGSRHFVEHEDRAPIAHRRRRAEHLFEIGIGELAASDAIWQPQINLLVAENEFVRRRTIDVKQIGRALARRRAKEHHVKLLRIDVA